MHSVDEIHWPHPADGLSSGLLRGTNTLPQARRILLLAPKGESDQSTGGRRLFRMQTEAPTEPNERRKHLPRSAGGSRSKLERVREYIWNRCIAMDRSFTSTDVPKRFTEPDSKCCQTCNNSLDHTFPHSCLCVCQDIVLCNSAFVI